MWRRLVPWCLLVAALAPLLAFVGAAQAAPYTLDPTHTFASIEFDNGLTTTRVRFDRKQGRVEFDRAGRRGEVEISVDMASLNSGLPALDARLRSDAVFDVVRFPQATFTGSAFSFDGDRVAAVSGTLTLRGQAQPVTLKALRFDCYLNPLFKRQVCGGDFEATLETSRLGLPPGNEPTLPERVRLLVQVEAIGP
jgi:polyisoprenoid-binding protein YceI